MRRRSRVSLSLALLLAVANSAAHAGRSCETKPMNVATIQRAMLLAEHTAAALDASGAQAVVLARAGQNLSEYGVHYSHLGFAYRDGARWRTRPTPERRRRPGSGGRAMSRRR